LNPVPPFQRFTQLSAPRQALVRLMQTVNFGFVLGVIIRNGDPLFYPEPTALIDVRLDVNESGRQEEDLQDFALRDEIRRLMVRLDEINNGRIERIEVRSGIPRRIFIERRLTEGRV
jgi:hypothetical protein